MFEHCRFADNIKFSGERVFKRKFGTKLEITERKMEENILLCRALGHVMTKIKIEFRGCEIEKLINFVEKYVNGRNIEQIEISYIPGGIQVDERVFGKIQNFLQGFGEKFPNLKDLIINHQGQPTGCYFLFMPPLSNLRSLNAVGDISYSFVWDVLVDAADWKLEVIPNGLLFLKN